MKILILILSIFAIDAPLKIQSGQNSYGAVTIENIQAEGLIKLNGTSVINTLYVNGSLITKNAHIGNLEISGEANLTDTTIQKAGYVFGSIQAVRTTFLEHITLLTQKAVFTGSRLEGITVRQDSAIKGKQVIELKQGTQINGPIIFESGKGEVIIFPGCQVFGKVTGGKIIRKN